MMRVQNINKLGQIGSVIILAILLLLAFSLLVPPTESAYARGKGTPALVPTEIPRGDNLLFNGSAEYGFYPVPELGFEAEDIGNIPHYWSWFKSNTYGKYNIDNNTDTQLMCPDDDILGTTSKNAFGIYIQASDQADARLGFYQTVDVVPGKDYVFSISGTIQVQDGASSPDINNNVILAFDHTGGSNWTAIPIEAWNLVPWREQEYEFKLSSPEDPDLAEVEEYYTIVTARSDKMTVFIGAWRRWANWRTSVVTFDCISLIPLDKLDRVALAPILSKYSTTDVDIDLRSTPAPQPDTAPTAQPASASDSGTEQEQTQPTSTSTPTPAPAPTEEPEPSEPAEIPDSGGILETKDNWLLMVIVSVIVISGLMGAGIWNIRRNRQN
jgi:hypothetical protein